MNYRVDPHGNNQRLIRYLLTQEANGQIDAKGAQILAALRANGEVMEP